MSSRRIKIISTCDNIILFSLYAIAFFLPISKAIIEGASSVAIICYLVKKLVQWEDILQTHLNIPIFSYFIICIFSIFISSNLGTSARTFFFKTLQHIAFFFVVVGTLNNRQRLINILFILLISSALLGTDGIFQYFTHKDFFRHRPYRVTGRISASLVTPNDFGCYLVSVLPFAIVFAFGKLRKITWRILSGILSLFLFICLSLTLSKGAWYGFLASVIFISMWTPFLLFFSLAAALFIVMTKQYYTLAIRDRLDQLFVLDPSTIGDSGSIERKMILPIAWRIFVSKPWLGIGLGTFMFNFSKFIQDNYPYGVAYAHNCYLQIAAEIGIIGLLSFLSILILFFYQGIRILNTKQKTFFWHVLLGSLGAIVGYGVHMSVDTVFYSVDLGMMFWLILGFGTAALKNLELEENKITATP